MKHHSPVNILLVDDQPAKLLSYEVILADLNENLIKASSAREAFAHLLRTDVAVVLVDVCMPDLDGFQLVRMLREHPRFEKTAVIFISAIHQTEIDLLRGYETGAVDYVPVPVVPEILRAKVRIFAELHRKTQQLENINRELEQRVAERTAELQRSAALLRESEERLRLASEAAEFGTYDYNVKTDQFHCSPQLKRLLETDIEGPLSLETFVGLCDPEDQAAVRQCLEAAITAHSRRHEIMFRVQCADGSVRWLQDRGASFALADDDPDSPSRIMGTIIDVTDHKQAEQQQELLMAELDHRVKNVLANVAAVLRLSSRRYGSIESFADALDGRIQAMSRAHGLLSERRWISAQLEELATAVLHPFQSSNTKNIVIRGAPISLAPRVAQTFALLLHELATNAVKYGALSNPDGRVYVEWSPAPGKDRHRLCWRETGGPPIEKSDYRGFGLTMLEIAAGEIGADVDISFERTGLACQITGTIRQSDAPYQSAWVERAAPRAVSAAPPARDAPLRILIVEDDALVAHQLQSELESAGYTPVGPAHTLQSGLELARDAEIDAALIDIRLGQKVSSPIADQLIARGIPFAFATGYSSRVVLPPHLRGIPTVNKPYQVKDIRRLLSQLTESMPA